MKSHLWCYFSLLRHSPWMIYFDESHTARIRTFGATSRWCGIRGWMIYFNESHTARKPLVFSLMRHSPHKNKRAHLSRNASIPLQINSLIFTWLIAYAQKKYHPRQFNVRNGTRVRLQGLEPCTPWLRVRCSTKWARGAFYLALFTECLAII